jgi:group I intron endonuclease
MRSREYVVYKHTGPTGKSYIGLTKNYASRTRQHRTGFTGCTAFVSAVKKYGWDTFSHEILISNLDLVGASFFERLFIAVENTLSPNGYNIKDGGNSSPCAEETKLKISQAQKGKPRNSPPWNTGRLASPETREKQSASAKARGFSLEAISAMTRTNLGNKYRLGHKHSDETKSKMIEKRLGKKMPAGALQKSWETRRRNKIMEMES